MSEQITIPVFFPSSDDSDTFGEPASIANRIKEAANTVISNLSIDEESLGHCVNSALSVINFVQGQIADETKVSLDTLELELGVAFTGKVGFSGSGVDIDFAAVFHLTFKTE